MRYETVRVSCDGAVGRLTLSNPAKLNPLSVTCLGELAHAARWFDGRPEVKAVVVKGEGRAFTAGADLEAFTSRANQERAEARDRADGDAGRLMAEAVTAMRAVTIAAIHGHCVGGGVVLAAACDIRVAAKNVTFAIPEANLGVPLAWGGIPRLVREIGPAATRDLVLSCRPFYAAEAQALGFVTRVVDLDKIDEVVDGLAHDLTAKSGYTLRAVLQSVNAAAEAMVPTGGAWSDADSLTFAFFDSESRQVARRYLARLGH